MSAEKIAGIIADLFLSASQHDWPTKKLHDEPPSMTSTNAQRSMEDEALFLFPVWDISRLDNNFRSWTAVLRTNIQLWIRIISIRQDPTLWAILMVACPSLYCEIHVSHFFQRENNLKNFFALKIVSALEFFKYSGKPVWPRNEEFRSSH